MEFVILVQIFQNRSLNLINIRLGALTSVISINSTKQWGSYPELNCMHISNDWNNYKVDYFFLVFDYHISAICLEHFAVELIQYPSFIGCT